MINNIYKILSFIILFIACLTPFDDQAAQIKHESHINDNDCPRWTKETIDKTRLKIAAVCTTIGLVSDIFIVHDAYNYIKNDGSYPLAKCVFYYCYALSSCAIACYQLYQITKEPKSKMTGIGQGSYVYSSRTTVNHEKECYLSPISCAPDKDKNWQKISIAGLIVLESIASHFYEQRLTEFQKECPDELSWLIPPQKFETVASFNYKGREFPLRRIAQEGWIKRKLRTHLSPRFPQRSLALQEKILTLASIKLLQKRIGENQESKDIGTLNKLPNEILDKIFCIALNKDKIPQSKITITKSEFFIHLFPYIFVRDQMQYFITDFSDHELDVQPPKDTIALFKKYYSVFQLKYLTLS